MLHETGWGGKETPWEWKLWRGGGGGVGGGQVVWRNVQENRRQQLHTSDRNCWALLSFRVARNSYDAPEHSQLAYMRAHGQAEECWQQLLLVLLLYWGNPRNGTVRNFRYLRQSFTFLPERGFRCLQFSQHLSLIYHLKLLLHYPDVLQLTICVSFYAGIVQVNAKTSSLL